MKVMYSRIYNRVVCCRLCKLLLYVIFCLLVSSLVVCLGTNYTVSTLTGDMDGADTHANVYVTLYGEKGDSGFRKLETKHFGKGK